MAHPRPSEIFDKVQTSLNDTSNSILMTEPSAEIISAEKDNRSRFMFQRIYETPRDTSRVQPSSKTSAKQGQCVSPQCYWAQQENSCEIDGDFGGGSQATEVKERSGQK